MRCHNFSPRVLRNSFIFRAENVFNARTISGKPWLELVVGIVATVGAGLKPAPTTPKHGLPEIIRALKTFSARKINDLVRAGLKPALTGGEKLWQRNYWEHIIRDEQSHQRIADYIVNNPINWEKDKFYTE